MANEHSFLEKYVKRDKERAYKSLLELGPKILEDVTKDDINNCLEGIKSKDLKSTGMLAVCFFNLSGEDEALSWDYGLQMQLLIEAFYLGDALYELDEEKGTFFLSQFYDGCPAILNEKGEDDTNAEEEASRLKIKYLKKAWEEYGYIPAGERLAMWMLMPFMECYDPKKGIELLKLLEQEDEENLSPLFYTTLGQEYLSGENISRDVAKAKSLFQKAYDKGDEGALIQMDNLMKRYRISGSNNNAASPKYSRTNYSSNSSSSKSQGCYVATCVYGSYDCPEVWVLRRFRDFRLSKSFFGRLFIKLYYFTSPKIIRLFGNKKWFRSMWRKQLDKMVNKYRELGFSDSPYNDPTY